MHIIGNESLKLSDHAPEEAIDFKKAAVLQLIDTYFVQYLTHFSHQGLWCYNHSSHKSKTQKYIHYVPTELAQTSIRSVCKNLGRTVFHH